MPRIWLRLLVFCSMSVYLLENTQAGMCTCTIAAHTPVPTTDSSPLFIERASQLSNQVHLWAQDKTQCTHLCKTVTQLYTRIWGITPTISKAQFST